MEDLIQIQKELKTTQEDLKASQRELKTLKKENLRLRNTNRLLLVALVLLIATLFAVYYFNMQKLDSLRNENETLRKAVAMRAENNEFQNEAEEILSVIENDSLLQKYYNADSLVYVDCVSNFPNGDYIENSERGQTIAGSLSIPKFFCKEYNSSASEYVFLDKTGLKAAFRVLNKGDFGVRSNKRFMFTVDDNSDLSEKIELLTRLAFLSLKVLKEGQGNFLTKLDEKIAQVLKNQPNSEKFFRFFFATISKNIYLVAVIHNGRLLGYYLASNLLAVNRASISEALKTNLEQIGDGLDIRLWAPDEKLNDSADFDTCIDIFIKQLAERN
ncbi:MAG: hypothetical protein IJ859_01140 [Synergistaceae bacterium]|nr:hypothetical protein [Synergistaceae bacterium]